MDELVIGVCLVLSGVVYLWRGSDWAFAGLGRLHHAYRRGTGPGDFNYWATRIAAVLAVGVGLVLIFVSI